MHAPLPARAHGECDETGISDVDMFTDPCVQFGSGLTALASI